MDVDVRAAADVAGQNTADQAAGGSGRAASADVSASSRMSRKSFVRWSPFVAPSQRLDLVTDLRIAGEIRRLHPALADVPRAAFILAR
jgi:hypothetical protein